MVSLVDDDMEIMFCIFNLVSDSWLTATVPPITLLDMTLFDLALETCNLYDDNNMHLALLKGFYVMLVYFFFTLMNI